MRPNSIRELLIRRKELKQAIRRKLQTDASKVLIRTRQRLAHWVTKIKADEELRQAVRAVGLTEGAKVLAANLKGRELSIEDELNFERLKLIVLGDSVASGKTGKKALQKEMGRALGELEILLEENPENKELENFLLELLIWSHNPDPFIQIIKEKTSKRK